jgi:hypothetical protein
MAASNDSFNPSELPPGGFDVRGADAPAQSAPHPGDASGRLHGLLEHAAAATFLPLFGSALLLSFYRLQPGGGWWQAVPGLLLGLVCADFVTGLVHWAADTYCEETTPVIGRSLIGPFRVHHVRPQEICEHGVVETLGNTCILAAPLLTLFVAAAADEETSRPTAFVLFTSTVAVGLTVATNQFHKWAHQDAPPRPVRALQAVGLILGPGHHQAHHSEPFEASYAITNGWLNPLLNRTRFFRRLEGALRAFGVRPAREGRRAHGTTET